MNFKVVDEHGRQLAMGRNLAELRSELGQAAQESFRTVAEADESVAEDLADHITVWNFGELPELMESGARTKRSSDTLLWWIGATSVRLKCLTIRSRRKKSTVRDCGGSS